MKRRKVNIGDIFYISLKNGKYVYGQVAAESRPRCYVIFDFVSCEIVEDTETIQEKDILLLTFMFDEYLVKGIWKIIGNSFPPDNLYIPEYKTEMPSGFYVLHFTGEIIRKASPEEEQSLKYFSYITAPMLEDLINYYFIEGYNITEYQKKLFLELKYFPLEHNMQ